MTSPVNVISDTARIAQVDEELSKLGISALPVVDRMGAMVGVISRTDLLRVGRTRRSSGHPRKVLTLPEMYAREVMTPTVEIVTADVPLHTAARRMVRQHLHRLFVSDDRRPKGVISVKEMIRAVAFARIETPIAERMHKAIVSVNASDSLALAIDRMAASHHSGLIVLEDGWPVGVFTQADALAAREAPPEDRVDEWMDPRIISVPLAMPMFRAAEQIVATRARRLLAVDGNGTRGVLTGMDFTRLIAESS
jgi:CBS domain-containing protein